MKGRTGKEKKASSGGNDRRLKFNFVDIKYQERAILLNRWLFTIAFALLGLLFLWERLYGGGCGLILLAAYMAPVPVIRRWDKPFDNQWLNRLYRLVLLAAILVLLFSSMRGYMAAL